MKNLAIGMICMGLLGGITSCSDFLKEAPKSEISTKQYFALPSHAYAAVNKLYKSGAPTFFGNNGVYMPSTCTLGGFLSGFFDNSLYKGQEVVIDYSQRLLLDSKNIAGTMDQVWDDCFSAIARANTAIKYIPNTPDLTDAEKSTLLGQAKFFRAFNYFYLVKFFGDVPLILEPYEALADLYIARTPSEQVYTQIVSDLNDAVGSLVSESFTKNGFKISKTTAESVLADVYLNMSGFPLNNNKYAVAATAARNVINSGKHTLLINGATPEESAYNQIRTLDDSNEYIYSLEFESSIDASPSKPTTSLPNKAVSWGIFKYSITNNAYAPLPEYLNVYDPANDLRIQERQFFHTSYTYEKDGKKITETFEPTPYLWYDEDALLNTGKSGKDVAIYRYAEVLLIAAEAIAQSEGVTTEAIGYLADVRARAYTKMTRNDIIASLSGLSKDDFVKEVWIERMRELALEMRTWSDIQRTRMYPVTADNAKGKVTFVPVVGAKTHWGQTFQEKHLLWPISDNEMQRNPSLVQNPGYDK